MARGGKRPGAGRPRGAVQRATKEARAKAAASGETPLDHMLRVMRNEKADEKRRDSMAVAAAPYVHAKLSATEVTGKDGGPVEVKDVSGLELARRIAFLLTAGASPSGKSGS